jgi:RNA 2',3'-cyclic 3'-phosphodiesterase
VLADNASQPARPEMARVFFALWPPEEIAGQLAGIADEFAKKAGGRPTRRETIHLTLAFLGDIAVERLPELQRVAGEVHAAAFNLTLDRFGLWQHNRLLWAGCAAPPVIELATALKTRLLEAGFTMADAKRPFAPHVTLVRKVANLETPLPAAIPLIWRCQDFVLVRSQLSAEGSIYEVLAHFPLVAWGH